MPNNLLIIGSSRNNVYSGNNRKEIWEHSVSHVTCMHTYEWRSLSQTQVPIHPAHAIRRRRASLILTPSQLWHGCVLWSDLAKPCKLKPNLPPVYKKRRSAAYIYWDKSNAVADPPVRLVRFSPDHFSATKAMGKSRDHSLFATVCSH